MASDRAAVERALTKRLKRLLGSEKADHFVGGTHTRRFVDNLLPTFPTWQVDELYAQLDAGSGRELRPNKHGKRRAHAPYSSATLAFNAFGRWLGSEHALSVGGLTDLHDRLTIEAKKKINYGGGTANLDVLLSGGDLVVGVESKLAEHAATHDPVEWAAPYCKPQMRQLLDRDWRQVFDDSLSGRWQPRRLGIEQLIKHVLGLRCQHAHRAIHLVYVFWEPANPDDHAWVGEHGAEVADLEQRVAGSEVPLHAMSYWKLLDEWAHLPRPPAWLSEHITAMHCRYHLRV